jgi:hypothetical protein
VVVGSAVQAGVTRPRLEPPFRIGNDHAIALVGQCQLFRRQRLLTRVALDLLGVRLGADLLAGLGALGEGRLLIRRSPAVFIALPVVPASAQRPPLKSERDCARGLRRGWSVDRVPRRFDRAVSACNVSRQAESVEFAGIKRSPAKPGDRQKSTIEGRQAGCGDRNFWTCHCVFPD